MSDECGTGRNRHQLALDALKLLEAKSNERDASHMRSGRDKLYEKLSQDCAGWEQAARDNEQRAVAYQDKLRVMLEDEAALREQVQNRDRALQAYREAIKRSGLVLSGDQYVFAVDMEPLAKEFTVRDRIVSQHYTLTASEEAIAKALDDLTQGGSTRDVVLALRWWAWATEIVP